MYTLEQLRGKNLNELKEIGCQLNVLPAGDRRQKQTWIDAIAGVNPPLLELLEVSPAAEVESVAEPIEIQAETFPGVSPVENCTEADRPPNRGDSGRGRLESEPTLSQSAIAPDAKIPPAADRIQKPKSMAHELLELFKSSLDHALACEAEEIPEAIETSPGVSFSPRFLALYSPPQTEKIYFKAGTDGQLSLLDFEVQSEPEPPDPDDFESIDAFREAIALWDAEHPEPLEISLASMREWAPCLLEWYEPETNETVSCTLEIPSMPILFDGCAASSDTYNFSIPVFGDFADRPNGNDEPPTAGVGARLPKPKPPSFPSAENRCPCGAMPVPQCDGTTATHIYPDRIVYTSCYKQLDDIGIRGSPGGDAMVY